MAEPASGVIVGAVASGATLAGMTLAYTGLTPFALGYGFVGAIGWLVVNQVPLGRVRAVGYVLFSMVSGAVMGSAAYNWLALNVNIYLICLCMVCAFGAVELMRNGVSGMIDAMRGIFSKWGSK